MKLLVALSVLVIMAWADLTPTALDDADVLEPAGREPPRTQSERRRLLGESEEGPCGSCRALARRFKIEHKTVGQPPAWGTASDHAKGCWVALDCNLASGLPTKVRSAPGLEGFEGVAPTQGAPNVGRLENGMIDAMQAASKPVDAEFDYKMYEKVDWEKVVKLTMFSTTQVRIVGKSWNWQQPADEPMAQQWSGTAWFIAHSEIGDGTLVKDSTEKLLVTNAHVAADAVYAVVMVPSAGSHGVEVEVLGTCVARDLALLRVKSLARLESKVNVELASLPDLKLGDSDEMIRAQQVMVLGYPLGLAGVKASMGFVSGYQQFEKELYMQVTAPIDGGNSGGPLLNANGQVVGVVSAKIAKASGMSFAIPSKELRAMLGALYTQRYVSVPVLGVPQSATSRNVRDFFGIPADVGGSNQSGLLIDSLQPSSLLKLAGVQPGDVVLTLDGSSVDRFAQVWVEPINERVHLDTFLARKEMGSELVIEIWRAAKGPVTKLHKLRIKYQSTPQLAIPTIPETVADPPQHVTFGGVAMMNLTWNIVEAMFNSKLAKYADPAARTEPKVVVVDVSAESPAGIDGSISPGSVVKQVNGMPVSSIAGVCQAMSAGNKDWATIHTDRGMLILTRSDLEQFECNGGRFDKPNQLCQWSCPEEKPKLDLDALIKGLNKEKEEKDSENKDDENKDDENKDGENKDDENKDDDEKDNDKKDDDNKDDDKKDDDEKDDDEKDDENKDGDKKDDDEKDDDNKDDDKKDDDKKDDSIISGHISGHITIKPGNEVTLKPDAEPPTPPASVADLKKELEDLKINPQPGQSAAKIETASKLLDELEQDN